MSILIDRETKVVCQDSRAPREPCTVNRPSPTVPGSWAA